MTAMHARAMAKDQNVHGHQARLKSPANAPPTMAPPGAVAPKMAKTMALRGPGA